MSCAVTPNLLFWTMIQAGECPKAEGGSGCGKSDTTISFAKALGRKTYTLTGGLLQPTDFAIPSNADDGRGGLKTILPPNEWVSDMISEGGDKWFLLLDEITQCAPDQQKPLMLLIKERRVGNQRLPDGLLMCALCNPPDVATGGNELEPPMANRMAHLEWEDDVESWEAGMRNGGVFPPPRFPLLPASWREHLVHEGTLVQAFHHHKPGLLQAMPRERALRSGAWPSKRTWHMLCTTRAALRAIDAPMGIFLQAAEACVGHGAAMEFQTWEINLDLPDPEDWIDAAIRARRGACVLSNELEIPGQCDRVMAILGALVDAVGRRNLTTEGKIDPEALAGSRGLHGGGLQAVGRPCHLCRLSDFSQGTQTGAAAGQCAGQGAH